MAHYKFKMSFYMLLKASLCCTHCNVLCQFAKIRIPTETSISWENLLLFLLFEYISRHYIPERLCGTLWIANIKMSYRPFYSIHFHLYIRFQCWRRYHFLHTVGICLPFDDGEKSNIFNSQWILCLWSEQMKGALKSVWMESY